MAHVYVSYKREDRDAVEALAPLLEARGHKVKSDQALPIGSSWRTYLMTALQAADVDLVLWSPRTWASQFVAAEVGTARGSDIPVLPVLIGDTDIPPFLQDLMVERIVDTDQGTLEGLAERLDASIAAHVEQRGLRKLGKPKIFISHRHKDRAVAEALVNCIELTLDVERPDVRCTSVSPYRLPVGERTSDRLQSEIADAEVVLGTLTTDTLESSYVAFELGAAWGQGVWTCPLLCRGATQAHIPDPIRDLSPLFLASTEDCEQLLDDLASFTSLAAREVANGSELASRVQRLVAAAAAPG